MILHGISKDPAAEHQAATTESLSVDVTRKPLIALVWGGFYVMMAGAFTAFLKRSREARQASLLAESRAAVERRAKALRKDRSRRHRAGKAAR